MVLIKDCILSNINLIITFYTFWLKPLVTNASLNFKVTKWSTRIVSEREFLPFLGLSLEDCVFECSVRSECKSVCFKRRMNFCELHLAEVTDFANPDSTDSCVYIHRQDINFPEVDTACSCGVGKVCEVTTGQCISKECQPFHITNGTIYGNMWHISAKQHIECDDGYEALDGVNSVVCRQDGTWNFTPACVLSAATTKTESTVTPESATTTTVSATTTPESATTTSVNTIDCSADWMHPTSNTSFEIKFSASSGKYDINVCQNISARLVKIDIEWKQTFIKEALTTCTEFSHNCHWIDGGWNGTNWVFSDSSDMPTSSVFWNNGVPSPTGNDVCVSVDNGDLWGSKNCNNNCKYICELVSPGL